MTLHPPASLRRDEGSFRDPSGQVWLDETAVYRLTTGLQGAVVDQLQATGLLQSLIEDKLLIETRPVDVPREKFPTDLLERFPRTFLHPKLSFISYPCEWTPLMLAQAADLTLSIQERLIAQGFGLKDATPYNVQFVSGRPVFIDAGSFEQPDRRDIWHALGQFERLFLYPLILGAYRGWDFRSYFLGRMDGMSPQEMSAVLGGQKWWRPSLWLDCTLPYLLERRWKKQDGKKTDWKPGKDHGPQALKLTLRRLRRQVQKLATRCRRASEWQSYTNTCTYEPSATAHKRSVIENWLKEIKPDLTLDVGCNTGEYSLAATVDSREVISADTDVGCVEQLHVRAGLQSLRLTAVVLDISTPTPAFGHLNRERRSFFDRVSPDCVLALALTHHLRISSNLDAGSQARLFASLSRRFVIAEFVPRDDEMFRTLSHFRDDHYDDWTEPSWIKAFETHFVLRYRTGLAGSTRALFLFEAR